jgi:hypothetical protein
MWLGFDVTRKTQKEEKKIAKKFNGIFCVYREVFALFALPRLQCEKKLGAEAGRLPLQIRTILAAK